MKKNDKAKITGKELKHLLYKISRGPNLFFGQELYNRQNSLDAVAGYYWLENPDPVMLNTAKTIEDLQKLKRDGHLTAVIESRKSGTTSLLWEIDRGKAKSSHTKFITDVFNNIDVYNGINEILECILNGYQPMEPVWISKNGKWIPKSLMGKPPEWFVYDTDNNIRFLSKNNTMGDEIPKYKIIVARNNSSYKNPYGEALLAKVFWYVTFKMGTLKYWMKFVEKYGMPFAVGKVPRGAGDNEYTNMMTTLMNAVQDFCAAIPDDESIDIMQTGSTTSSDIYDTFVNFANAEMSKTILGQTLTTEAGDKGSRALGDVHMDVRQDLIEKDIRIVEDVYNKLIKWVIELNFGEGHEVPTFSLFPEFKVDKSLAERDAILSEKLGVKFKPSYISEKYNIDEKDFEIKEDEIKNENDVSDEEDLDEIKNSAFKYASENFDVMEALDQYLNGLEDKELIKQGDFVKPIIDLVKSSSDFGELNEKLMNIFYKLRPELLETELGRGIFNSKIVGKISADNE